MRLRRRRAPAAPTGLQRLRAPCLGLLLAALTAIALSEPGDAAARQAAPPARDAAHEERLSGAGGAKGLAAVLLAAAVLIVWRSALWPFATRLRKRLDRLRLLERAIERAPAGLLIADAGAPGLPIVLANPALAELTDGREGDGLSRWWRPAGEPEGTPARDSRAEPAPAAAGPARVLIRRDGPDGRPRWHQLTLAACPDRDGAVTHYCGLATDVTESRRLETAVLHHFEQSGELFCAVGFDGRFLEVSPAWQRLLGHAPSELRSRECVELLHPEDRDAWRGELERLIAGGQTADFVSRFRTRAGDYRALQWDAAASAEERVVYATGRDVTSAAADTAAVDEWKTRYEAVISASGHVLYEWDVKTDAVSYGGSLEQTLGYRPEELSGLDPWLGLVHPQDRRAFEAEVARVRSGGSAFALDYRVRHRDGRYLYVRDQGRLIEARDGGTRMVGLVVDVSDREDLANQLRERAERIRLVTDGLPVAIIYLDAQLRLRVANKTYCDWHGCGREELLGRIVTESSLSETHALIGPHLSAVMAGQTVSVEERCAFPDGVERDLIATLLPHRERNGRVRTVGLYGMIEDVTERRQLEKQLQVSQKLEAVGRLAGGVAHDFNNVLSVVLGQSAILARRMPADDPAHRRVREIQEAAGRAAELTRQLLTFSRKQVVEPRLIDLNDTIREMEKLLRRILGEDVELETVLGDELGSIRADPSQLEQIVVNLVVNARDAMPEGGELRIETGLAEVDEELAARNPVAAPGAYVTLAVTDTGIGMDEATRSRLFEPFFTTKGEAGTGLGLATVYGIVKESGGWISVASAPGAGATFRIHLPRSAHQAPPRETPVVEGDAPGGSETVLVVEDETSLREIAVESLSNLGYRVLEAANGQVALEISRSHPGPIHLLMTDVVMPGINGRQLYRELSATRPETRILYTSGYTDDIVVKHGISSGRTAFLQKPYALSSLARAVRDAIRAGSPPAEPDGE